MQEPEGSLGGGGKLETGRIDPACKRVFVSHRVWLKSQDISHTNPEIWLLQKNHVAWPLEPIPKGMISRAERHCPLEARQGLSRWPQGSAFWRDTCFSTRPLTLVLNFISFLKGAVTQKIFKNYVPSKDAKTWPGNSSCSPYTIADLINWSEHFFLLSLDSASESFSTPRYGNNHQNARLGARDKIYPPFLETQSSHSPEETKAQRAELTSPRSSQPEDSIA